MPISLRDTPPSQEHFDELKEKAIEVWKTFDNKYGYVDGKIRRIKDLPNVGSNFMYMLQMFDVVREKQVMSMVSVECQKAILDRLNPF